MRTRVVSLLFCLLVALPACGGGGGSSTPADTSAPGELRALAVQGQPAPGTAGDFAAFPTFPFMDAAAGGWCAFVAPTTDATKSEVLYVAEPDDVPTIVEVFAVGDAAPAPSAGGTITGFQGVWMCDDGSVICFAELAGDAGGRTFGLLTATVTGGMVVGKVATLYDQASLAAVVPGGVLGAVDTATLLKQDDGTIWFLGLDTTGGQTHLLSITRTGTSLTRRASPGDLTTNVGVTFATIDAFGIDPTGTYFALAVTTTAGDRRMYLKESSGGVNAEILKDTDPLPSGAGTAVDAYKGGRLVVFAAGQVVWTAEGSLSASDDVSLFYGHFLGTPYVELARTTLTAPSTGSGTWNSLDPLNMAPGCQVPQFDAGVTGGTFGITRGTFGVADTTPTVGLISGNIVLSGGMVVSSAYISLRQTTRPYDEVSTGGDAAYVMAWSGTTALFWFVRGNNTFPVAAQGGPEPGGDTFGAFVGSAAHTIADDVVLFRANLTMAGSGVFRQGP